MILFVIIWFLVVFLFFLLLHLYAKKFLPQLDETNQTPGILLAGARVHLRRGFLINANANEMNLRKGLEPCEISTIPQFIFEEEKQDQEGRQWPHGLECVICLSSFENGQLGRRLPSCIHAFHVECIDMWLHTHTTCPVCRASAVQVSSLSPENEVGPQDQSEQRPSYSREMSGHEVSSRLEVIVELPSVENQ